MSDTTTVPKPPVCPYCGQYQHSSWAQCPRISAIEYHPNGTVKRVELKP
jgi:hypothetical protein